MDYSNNELLSDNGLFDLNLIKKHFFNFIKRFSIQSIAGYASEFESYSSKYNSLLIF